MFCRRPRLALSVLHPLALIPALSTRRISSVTDRALADHSAIITGGSRGIGRAVAHQMALEGISCTLVGREKAALQHAVEELPRSDDLLQHQYVAGDVRETALWETLFAQKPNVHYLVNAAGITHTSLLARIGTDKMQDILDVNLYGTMLGSRFAMRNWISTKSTDRCIVNIASLLAVRGGRGASVYAASKAGVVAFTRALAGEGADRRIRANVILPGYITTDMTAVMPPNQLENLKARIPAGRFGLPEEVADAVMFVVKNRYANNCVLNLDGGLSTAT